LEGNGTRGFTTPLATTHAFQGWADAFVQPLGGNKGFVDGLEDLNFTLNAKPRWKWDYLFNIDVLVRYHDFNDETVVMLRLTRLSSAPEANDPIATAKRVDLNDPEYRELDQRLTVCRTCKNYGDWVPASRQFEAAALDSGRYLDAALARAERVLGACERDSAWSKDVERRVKGDTAIAACRAGLAWRDSAGAAAALRQLDRVNGAGLDRSYVLDYLRGRARIATGDLQLGTYLMMGGLGGQIAGLLFLAA